MPTIHALPEEILSQILRLLLLATPEVRQEGVHRLSVLLVNSTFHRIGFPHYYHTVHLSKPGHAECFHTFMQQHPLLPRQLIVTFDFVHGLFAVYRRVLV